MTQHERRKHDFHSVTLLNGNIITYEAQNELSAGYIKDLWSLCVPGRPHRPVAASPLVALTGQLRLRPC